MYATFSFRFANGFWSFTKLDQSTFSAKCAAVSAAVHTATAMTIRRPLRDIEPPADGSESFNLCYEKVQREADQADEQHCRDHEVVSLARVSRVNHQVAEPGIHGDHLRRDNHEPGDAERDAEPGQDAGERGRKDHPREQRWSGQ